MKKKLIIICASLLIIVLVAVSSLNFWLNYQRTKPFVATQSELKELEFYKQPEQWFIQRLKKPRIEIDGQTLDPKFQYMMEQHGDTTGRELNVMKRIFSIALGRKFVRYEVDSEWSLYTKVTQSMRQTFDLEINGRSGNKIPIRIYVPDVSDTEEKLPVLIYAHGGGYLFGSIKASDRVVRLIANEAKVIVVSIEYRLAPEYPYPAPSDDGEDVFLWAQSHIEAYNGNTKKIAFGGDSGGGHISINVAQRQLAKHKTPPAMLLLYYPATGLPFQDKSNTLFGKGFGLDTDFFKYILTQVFPDQTLETARPDDYMAPLQAKNLSGMPPSIIATAGFDILRDSGKHFAEKLKANSVSVTYLNYPSLPHSFLQFSGIIKEADVAATETAKLFGEQIRK